MLVGFLTMLSPGVVQWVYVVGDTVGIYLDFNDVYNNLHTPQAKGTYMLRGFIEIKDAERCMVTH